MFSYDKEILCKNFKETLTLDFTKTHEYQYNENCVKNELLNKFQDFLNEYGVDCKLILLEQPNGEKGIYFDYKKPLDFFGNVSSGTEKLTDFYLKYMCGNKPTFIYRRI